MIQALTNRYIIVSYSGIPVEESISYDEGTSWRFTAASFNVSEYYLKQQGYTCKKVNITIEEVTAIQPQK